MRWFKRRKSSQLTSQQSALQQAAPPLRAGFRNGDRVIAIHFRHYEPGLIIEVPDRPCGLYHVDFGRFSLHLTAVELAADDGNGVDTRTHPGWLQNLFCELLVDGVAYAKNGQPVKERWLTGKFYNFGHNLPAKVCEKAGLEAGTTYAQAARRLRHDSDRSK